MLSLRILKAVEFATKAHKDQKRRVTEVPYIMHPFSVCLILLDAGYSEDVAIAGLLHDVVEDTEYTIENIKDNFGDRVAEMVLGVTEDKTVLNREEREKKYLDNIKKSDPEIVAISAADMLHNRICFLGELNEVVISSNNFLEYRESYLRKSYNKLSVLKDKLDNSLIRRIEEVLEEIKNFKA